MKLAFVSAHPAPYRDPFLRRLSNDSRVTVKIFTLYADDNAHAFWNQDEMGYDTEIVGVRGTHWFRMFLRLFRRIICGNYDLVCWPGFHRPCTKLAMVVCALLGKRYGFCADSISRSARGWLTMAVKRFVVKRASLIFVPGKASQRFFVEEFGYPAEKICLGQYALEGKQIEENVLRLRDESRSELRRKYGLTDEDVVFLMVANMTPTRHYPITASAFMRFAQRHPGARFVMVGAGPELEKMREMANGSDSLKVIPGVSFAEMQELYAVANVYVHGGAEPASTALVIGAIANLPVMSSSAVGCSADVVLDGETGMRVKDCLSEDDWVSAFERMLANQVKWKDWGERARELSRPLDCENVIDRFVEVVKSSA